LSLSVKAGGVALKEITVITDVRMSSDSPELILVRHPIGVVDGELQLVGESSESKVALLYRRVVTSVKWMMVPPVGGGAIVAEVKNTGFTPVEIDSVMFRVYGLATPESGNGIEKKGREDFWWVKLIPKGRSHGGILPGESQDWYLPTDFVQTQLQSILAIAPDKYKLVILSGKHPINEVLGEQLQPLLSEMEEIREPLISDALRMVLLSLPVAFRDQFDTSLKSLSEMPVDRWNKVSGLEKLDDSLYLLMLPPDYRVLLRRHRRGRIEVIDVARTPDRQPAAATG
jgi:hypothetical protein